jgi:hypothetical protein
MKVGLLVILLFYWSIFLILFATGYSEGSPFTADYNVTGSLNTTSIGTGEVNDSFFGGVLGVFGAIGRFFALALLGLGLPFDLPLTLQLFFSFWQGIISILTATLIISFFWED